MPDLHELRTNKHQQMLVDVGLVLRKAYGESYARGFLEEMAIPEPVIKRVVSQSAMRPMMHLILTSADR
jgi:hypothetical protein